MFQNLIKNYINHLTINDILNFAKTQNIYLTNDECNIIYNYIKNDWQTIAFGNPKPIFDELKKRVSKNTYDKAIELFNKYKSKIN